MKLNHSCIARRAIRAVAIVGLTLAIGVPVTLVGSETAGAVTGYKTLASPSLIERSGPGTGYANVGTLPYGTALDIRCQVQGGTNVNGNATWDRLANNAYIADYWTNTPSFNSFISGVPACGAPTPPPTPPPPPPAPTPLPPGPLVNHAHNLCLDAAAQSDGSNGGKVQLWSCWNGSNQRWARVGNELVNQAHGLCLDAAGQTNGNNGGTVQLWSCVNNANQQWQPVGSTLVNQAHHLCLDAAGDASASNGGTVELWSCWNGSNQQWTQGDELVNQAHGLCLDAAGETNASNGGKVQLWSCVNNANQQWVRNGNELVNQAHGLCLDAAGQNNGSNGGTIQLWSCVNNANQQWQQAGSTLVNQAHHLCLDAAAETDASNGGKVQLWSCWNGSNQQWLGRASQSADYYAFDLSASVPTPIPGVSVSVGASVEVTSDGTVFASLHKGVSFGAGLVNYGVGAGYVGSTGTASPANIDAFVDRYTFGAGVIAQAGPFAWGYQKIWSPGGNSGFQSGTEYYGSGLGLQLSASGQGTCSINVGNNFAGLGAYAPTGGGWPTTGNAPSPPVSALLQALGQAKWQLAAFLTTNYCSG